MADNSNVSEKDRKRREFILTGNPMAVVLKITLPLMAMSAFTYLSGIIDTIVVSQSDNNALSSVVMISQIKNLFTALGGGFSTGSSIIVSRLIGRGEYDKAEAIYQQIENKESKEVRQLEALLAYRQDDVAKADDIFPLGFGDNSSVGGICERNSAHCGTNR